MEVRPSQGSVIHPLKKQNNKLTNFGRCLSSDKTKPMRDNIEIWKSVVGYEGYYEVSDVGNVRRCARTYTNKGCNGKSFLPQRNKNLSSDKRGYKRVMLFKDMQHKTYQVHRLVGFAFIPNPGNKPEINHIDGNASNNEVSNLEWCTSKENKEHFSKYLLPLMNRKRIVIESKKFNWDDIRAIRSSTKTNRQLAETYDCTQTHIIYIKKRKSWNQVPQ
jgi:hypothetical protein